ncbi:MAG: aromatic acid/H+ symport family MFS transporter [Bacteroidota bacterium]|nr:aromatic acid/H+ symport family MFS transporter [Bacteroidota bacterium]
MNAKNAAYPLLMVAICVLLNMNDGIDISVLSFAAPRISQEWSLNKIETAWFFSAGLTGMMLGSFLIAPLGDRFGRKKIFLLSLALIATGMLLVAYCHQYRIFLLLRLVTGLGIGGILPALASVATENSSERWKDFNVGLVQAGWPIASIITGIVCAYVIPAWGWRIVFVFAGSFSLLMLIVVGLLMKTDTGTFIQERKGRLLVLLQPAFLRSTLLVWIGIFFAVFTLYTLMSWIPTAVKERGVSFQLASYAGVMLNTGAALGTASLGLIAQIPGLGIRKTVTYFLLMAVFVLLLLGSLNSTAVLFLLIFLSGFFVQGGFNGNYAVMARIYPAHIRSTGIGMAIGIGRFGAIVGPLLFGLFASAGYPMVFIFALFAAPLLVTACCVYALRSNELK